MSRIPILSGLLLGGLCALALCASPAHALVSAGGGFYFQSSQPFGWSVGSLTFAGAGDVWACTYNGHGSQLVHSADAGETWRSVDTGLGLAGSLDGFTFIDSTHARAMTALSWDKHGTAQLGLVESDDGGATWSVSPVAISDLEPWEACFPTLDGVAISGKQRNAKTGIWSMVMFTSSDGGASWTRRRLPVPYAYDVQTKDMRHFWLRQYNEGHHPSVFTSSDGGATWKEHSLPACTYSEDALQAIDATHASIRVLRKAKPHYLCYVTADEGRSWRRWATIPDPASGGLTLMGASEAWLSVSMVPELHDRTSYIEHTTDGGATWTRHYVGPRSFGGIVVSPKGTLFSHDGMWRSTDAGSTWTRLRNDVFDYWLNDVVTAGDGSLWAAGRSTPFAPAITGDDDLGVGLIYHCVDGVTWRQVAIPEVKPLRTIDAVGSAVIWAGGWDGAAIRSVDGGASWAPCDVSKDLSFEDIDAADAQSAVAIVNDDVHGGSLVLRTSDGGSQWEQVAQGGERDILRRVCRLSANDLLIAGTRWGSPNQAVFLRSHDGGATWSESLAPCPHNVGDMVFIDADHGWVVASDTSDWRGDGGSLVLRTADGGKTWQTTDLSAASVNGLTRIAFADAQHGWVLGDRILKTSDGGATWTDTGAAVPSPAVGLFFAQPVIRGAATVGGDLWAVGADQLILSTVDTSADTAPPLTADDGDRLWHNASVTTHLSACDPGGSGVAGTECRVDGGAWQTLAGSGITIDAPADHSADGDHPIEYRSTDAAGNVEFPQLCTVHVDTSAPVTTAGTARVHKGKGASLPYQVTDPAPGAGTATVRITIRGKAGGLAKRLFLGSQTVNKRTTTTFICKLPVGRYVYAVTAVDAAGNQQASAGTGTLTVVR